MKESKFVELLNLYIDQEISPPEAALLEEEIQRDPARRRVYLQYCRMHRASALLFESFRSETVPANGKLGEAARAATEKVVAFPALSPRRSLRWVYAAGLAAAACLAFVFVRQSATDRIPPNHGMHLTQDAAPPVRSVTPPAAVAQGAFASTVVPMTRREFTPVFVVRSLDTNRATLEWMQQIRLSPVPGLALENLVFETQPTLLQDQRTFRSSLPVQGNVDKVSFEFQH